MTVNRLTNLEEKRSYDGIICFGGEDWWYHNRGHYDMQFMQRFARAMPVLYVNSIGMRMPRAREGRMFLQRISRKLSSMSRRMVRVQDQLAVCSPIYAPTDALQPLMTRLLSRQVRGYARQCGMQRPLLWIACPTAAVVADQIECAGIVYQRTDRTECFADVSADYIRSCDLALKARADLTLFCTSSLLDEEIEQCREACLVDHGVDAEMFIEAGQYSPDAVAPDDLAAIQGPRVGFVGGIDAHTFDPALMVSVAQHLPHVHFVLIGACSLPHGWCDLPNVHLLGRKPYEQVAAYMAGCHVLMMPWNRSRWIQACNPIKLKEYLAVGRPVVSTSFPEVQRYRSAICAVDGRRPESFAAAIAAAIADPGDAESRRARVRYATWDNKATDVYQRLQRLGLHSVHDDRIELSFETVFEPCVSPRPAQEVEPKAIAVDSAVRAEDVGHQSPDQESDLPSGWTLHRASSRPVLDTLPQAIILLAGGTRPSELMELTGRNPLDLYVTTDQTLLDVWLDKLAGLMAPGRLVRVVGSSTVPPPWPRDLVAVTYEQDALLLRGSGGALHDCCSRYGPDAHVLVIESAHVPQSGIESLWQRHVSSGDDITIGVDYEHAPMGIMALRVGALATVAPVGYVDLREQWLQNLPATARASSFVLGRSRSRRICSRATLLDAARLLARPVKHPTSDDSPFDAQILRMICAGASVDPSATVVDSIVMPGAMVGAGAVLTRSVICSGGVVQSGSDLVDAIIGAVSHVADHPLAVPREEVRRYA